LHSHCIEYVWSVNRDTCPAQYFLCANDDVMVIMGMTDGGPERTVTFYNKHTRAEIASHPFNVPFPKGVFLTSNLIALLLINYSRMAFRAIMDIEVHFFSTTDGFRTYTRKTIEIVRMPLDDTRLNIDVVEGGIVIRNRGNEPGNSTQFRFARNLDLLRLYSHDEEISWKFNRNMPYDGLTALSIQNNVAVLLTEKQSEWPNKRLTQIDLSNDMILWEKVIDSELWRMPDAVKGRRLALHINDLYNKSASTIRCYDLTNGDEQLCELPQIDAVRALLTGNRTVGSGSWIDNEGLFVKTNIANCY
ncbi:hypothetical protein PFISCL1PPCAC_17093, partial [Pristionchus fissidentatus]